MDKEFVPYEPALELKELGFNEPCFAVYGKSEGYLFKVHTDKFDTIDELHFIKSPTYSQAFRWFREKYNLDSFVKHLYKSTIKVGYYFGIDEYKGIEFQMDLDDYYKNYEEAELECLKGLIKIAKSK